MGNITEKGSNEIKDILSLMERVEKRDTKNKEEKIQENNIKCYALTETNNTLPVPILEKSNAKRLIDKHTKDGYVILSACRGFEDFNLDSSDDNDICKHNTINNKRTKELIADIQQRKFSYTPAYGGFIENNGDSNSEEVYEQSVIVYPYKKDNTYNFDELYEFALEMCKKYNQDSVLIKQPNDLPKYVKQDGIVDFVFNGEPTFNDVSKTYFTDLHKNTSGKIKSSGKPTRFSFTESYVSQIPQSYSESHTRYLNGEIFITKK